MTLLAASAGLGSSDCQRIVDAALAQPVLAVTSLTYVIVGAVTLWWAVRDRTLLAVAAGVLLVAIGVGSFAYHGPQPSWAQPAHDWPIVAVAVVYAAALARTGLGQWRVWTVAAGIFALALVAYGAGRTGSPLCRPDSWWQYHGAWHVLSAVAAGWAIRALAPGRDHFYR